jgi:hypothetical protein
VTISSQDGRKVYTGVEKIYSLSDDGPMAALVYGLATIIDVPWATLLSEFRHRYGTGTFPSMQAAAEHVVGFLQERLRDRIDVEGDEMREVRMSGLISALNTMARQDFFNAVSADPSSATLSPEGFAEGIASRLGEVARSERRTWQEAPLLPSLTETSERKLHKATRPLANAIRKRVLAGISPSPATSRAVSDIALLSLTRQTPVGVQSPSEGGLVLVGFPEGEFWPRYVELAFDGVGLTGLRYWPVSSGGCDGPHAVEVSAFAQRDGVVTMMEGVHPDLRRVLYSRLVAQGLDRTQVREALDDAADTWAKQRTDPILTTLDVMPQPDLCEIAESLVSITALWQRMRGTLETVGGTISVAVLVPGGPLRWAKRPNLTTA